MAIYGVMFNFGNLHAYFYKQDFYKFRQIEEIGKKLSKC